MNGSRVELIVRIGREFKEHRIAIPVDENLLYELSEPVELSDDPTTLLLSGGWRGNDVIHERRKKFRLREVTAKQITASIVKALTEHFGRNDTIDGYKKDQAF